MTPEGSGATPEAVGPLASTGYWLHRISLAWLRDLDAALTPLGLTHTQFLVLGAVGWLSRENETPRQQAVADFAGVDRMMTSKVLAALEKADLVERVPDPDDARGRLCHLTPVGRATLDAATNEARHVDAEWFDDLHLRDSLRRQLARRG
ncbi:MarR family transcriptional regulator [Ammonicoccus fulvus]|uniref:MarR family transcriptional regulator n=1 Tax=Ammonicoccus fulvus TaxID=3138240 RepID=A0ABZ3FK15_9ACTN